MSERAEQRKKRAVGRMSMTEMSQGKKGGGKERGRGGGGRSDAEEAKSLNLTRH